MDKKRTTIYLREDVDEHRKENKINLSDWVNLTYAKHFLSEESLQIKIASLMKEVEDAKAELVAVKRRAEIYLQSFTDAENRYLSTVMERYRDGKEPRAMMRAFNSEFKRNLTFNEFWAMVQRKERQIERRLEAVWAKKKKRK